MIDLTVSVCHPKHLRVWSVVQENLSRFLPAREHLLVVPDASVKDFQAVTRGTFRIESESDHAAEYAGPLKAALSQSGQSKRYGWFLQQFIKIGALRGHSDTARLLIWDADTVPLRSIDFFGDDDDDGRVGYFSERMSGHEPMFAQIEALLGLPKASKRGFISQCFPLWGRWANDFFRAIEADEDEPWHERLIASIPFERGSALSEYELLGTFIATRYPTEMFWNDLAWVRNGHDAFSGPAEAAEAPQSSHELHLAAFEEYDRFRPTSVSVTLQNDFETTTEWNARRARELSVSLSAMEKLLPTGMPTPRLFIGLREDLERLTAESAVLRDAWSDRSLIDPGPERSERDVPDDTSIRGIPGSDSRQMGLHHLDARVAATRLRSDLLVSHPTSGLIIAPTRSQLAIRFWAELVEWDQSDDEMREVMDLQRIYTVDVVSWSELDIRSESFVLIHLVGFEAQVMSTFVEAMEAGVCVPPQYLGHVSAFEDVALEERLLALGYVPVQVAQEPDGFTPVLRAFRSRL